MLKQDLIKDFEGDPVYQATLRETMASNESVKRSRSKDNNEEKAQKAKAEIIFVGSPWGGTGKTTAAVGIGACLAMGGDRVLYLNADEMQGFGWIFSDPVRISDDDLYCGLARAKRHLFERLSPLIKHDLVDYLSPLRSPLYRLSLSSGDYARIAEQAAVCGSYDYIVLDGGSGIGSDQMTMMGMADYNFLLLTGNYGGRFGKALFDIEETFDHVRNLKWLVSYDTSPGIFSEYRIERFDNYGEAMGTLFTSQPCFREIADLIRG